MNKDRYGAWLSKDAILCKMEDVMDNQGMYTPTQFRECVLDAVIPITEHRGEWVKNIHDKTICSACGVEKSQLYDSYCACCGADMRKG